MQRPDKGSGVVVMNRDNYDRNVSSLIANRIKFLLSTNKQTEFVKSKINKIVEKYKDSNKDLYKVPNRVEEFSREHLYGLPKIKKKSQLIHHYTLKLAWQAQSRMK